ncbi:hypothetical protein BDB01DRAFT_782018 [Pilobolus umbonatus]|nr:hypothetical protein BDB01DRAFT_782018 [Pilobolus umbonatus]
MSQTLYNGYTETTSLLERRQQNAPYLQSLELPCLPPLSQLLTDKSTSFPKQVGVTNLIGDDPIQHELSSTINNTSIPIMVNNMDMTLQQSIQQQNTYMPTMQPLLYSEYSLPEGNTVQPDSLTSSDMILQPNLTDTSIHTLYPTNDIIQPADYITNKRSLYPIDDMAEDIDEMDKDRKLSISSSQSDKIYSFVALSGTTQKKRPRRRYDEVERLYYCNWYGCTKAYGTLNHLNAHVNKQQHGPKRQPTEFKELRKEWKRQKKERDAKMKRTELTYKIQHQSQMNDSLMHSHRYPFIQNNEYMNGNNTLSTAAPLSLNCYY